MLRHSAKKYAFLIKSFSYFDSRETILQVLKMAYLSLMQENLPIFGIGKQRSLSDYCTTEKDVTRGISRMPLVLSRIYEEDIKFDATPTNRRPVFKTSPSMVQRE